MVDIPRPTRYRLLIRYVLNSNRPVFGQVTISPHQVGKCLIVCPRFPCIICLVLPSWGSIGERDRREHSQDFLWGRGGGAKFRIRFAISQGQQSCQEGQTLEALSLTGCAPGEKQ